jgi:hypothetical protein
VLKHVTGDTHANIQVTVKRTRRVATNYQAQENLKLGLGKLVYEEN